MIFKLLYWPITKGLICAGIQILVGLVFVYYTANYLG